MHEMIVYGVGEMISRKSVGFEDDDIHVIFLQFDFSAYLVHERRFAVMVSVGTETDYPRFAVFDVFDLLVYRQITVSGISPIISRKDFVGFLEGAYFFQIFSRAEIRISFPLFHQRLDYRAVYVFSDGLLIWAVVAYVSVREITFVRDDAKDLQLAY